VKISSGIRPPFNREWRFLLGLAFAIGLQLTEGGFRGDPWGSGWWLDDGRRVVVGFLGVLVLALLTANSWENTNALWLGVNVGMAGVMFAAVGEGNLWPIVLAFGALITGSAIYFAWGVRCGLANLLAKFKKGRAL
jgi:hypothetical protein